MKRLFLMTLLAGVVGTPAALAQKWEVGGGVGGSFFTSDAVTNSGVSGSASLSDGMAASFWVGNKTSNILSGELRYDFEKSGLKLSSGGTTVNFGGDTQAIHYDFLLNFTPSEGSRIRPFVAGGAGIKMFQGTGKEMVYQPLENLALLSKTSQVEPLVSVGGGVKFLLSSNVALRVEAHDYLTPFPKNVIAPAAGSKLGGWLQDFVAMVGLSFSF